MKEWEETQIATTTCTIFYLVYALKYDIRTARVCHTIYISRTSRSRDPIADTANDFEKNERATLVSTMDQDGNVLYRIVTRRALRGATDVMDAMELDGNDIDGLAFTHQLLRQFLISAGWTYTGDARQRV